MLSVINKILHIEEKKDIPIQFWTLLGPFFIVITLFLTSFSEVPNKDLFLVAVIGLALCLKKKGRGLFYSSIMLLVLIFLKHFQISSNHLWQFGVELSLFLGFIISSYCIEETWDFINSFHLSNSDNRLKIEKLEEELKKEEDFHLRQHKNFKYEIDRVNLQLEEKKNEINSFKQLVQNLRETIKENEKQKIIFIDQFKEKDKSATGLRQEIEDLKEHILSLGNLEELYQRNQKLLNDLNQARVDKEQSHAINQSLSKMVSKEIEEKREKDEQNHSLIERATIAENKILFLQEEIALLNQKIKKYQGEVSSSKKEDLFFSKQIEEKKILDQYEKKYQELIKIESLYKQLKNQFEEKKKVLSDARKELFLTKEELEKIKKEKELRELDETKEVKELYCQIGKFEEELKRLEEENINLQEIISKLASEK